MTELKRIRRCYGCGIILQSLEPNLAGYVPEVQLEKHEVVLCQRCFKLQHYGQEDTLKEPTVDSDFLHILSEAKKQNALIVYVFDLFSFESSFVKAINKEIKGTTVLVVANKRDLLPREVSDKKLSEYVLGRAKKGGLTVSDIVITSPIKKYNMDELKEKIDQYRQGRNVYVIGAASSGKSSIVNGFLKCYSNKTNCMITTSPYPGTTLRVINIPLDDSSVLYDTPGISIDNSLIFKVEKEVLKIITPKVEVKPRTFQLNSGQSLIIGGIARFDFVKGPRTGFTLYLANPVIVTRTRIERADHTLESLIKVKTVKPISKVVQSIKDLEAFEVVIKDEKRIDVGITGLGWMTFNSNGQVLRVLAPKGVRIYTEAAKI